MGYGNVAGADAYHAARGNATWGSATSQAKSEALTRGADYVRLSYVRRFTAGFNETAADVEPATYEAALLELIKPGFFARTYTEADRKVLVEVKGIKWQAVGSAKDARSMAPTSTIIESLLWPYMARTYGAVTV